jgi:hypothetical protein
VGTPIMLQEVSEDGLSLVGGPVQILDRGASDGPLVEAPSLHVSEEGVYFLFFASGCFSSPTYATSYATSTSGVRGPYRKAGRPLLVTGDAGDLVGPGGLDVMPEGGGLVGFHGILGESVQVAKAEGVKATSGPLVRGMYSAKMTFEGEQVSFQLS